MDSDTRLMAQILLVVVECVIGLFCGQLIGFGIADAHLFGGNVWQNIQKPTLVLAVSMVVITTLILTLPKKK